MFGCDYMKSNVSLIIVNTFSSFDAEYTGVGRIAAYLRQHNITVTLVYLNVNEDSNLELLLNEIPIESNLIGFSIYNTNARYIYELCRLLKKRNPLAFTFVGSILATTAYNFILDDCEDIDFIVLGDGELTMYQVVLKYEDNDYTFERLPHIKTRHDQVSKYPCFINIETMPKISRDFFINNKKYNFHSARITGSSGCTAKCSFCAIADVYKPVKARAWRGRAVKDIFDEIVSINKEYGIRSFSFSDNSFEDPGTLGKKRIEEFCRLCTGYPIKMHFWCYLRAETFTEKDTELILLMKKAGFTQIFIGIEACNKDDLLLYNKNSKLEDNYRTYRLFMSLGIDVVPGYIMFNPFSTLDRLKDNFQFLENNNLAILKLYYRHLDVYYGTDIYHIIEQNGLLAENYTYLDSEEYCFKDPAVHELSKFIKKYIFSSKIEKLDGDYQTFMSSIAFIKAIYPDIIEIFQQDLSDIKKKLAKAMSDFFHIIYVENNINEAIMQFPNFEKIMEDIYNEFNILKMRILKQKMIQQLFTRTITK
jgi:radical SAM superfamily enzyme YgiQ (UPF0313 family)